MATGPSSRPSFSRARRWSIGFNVLLAIVVAVALAGMVNYLSGHYFKRFYLSSHTRIELSPRTVSLLRSLTNDVQVTLYYDKDEAVYSDVVDLLKAYRAVTPKIEVATVDYYRDPARAQEVKVKYKESFGASTNKNLIIFDCGGKVKVVPGSILMNYKLEKVPNSTENEFHRKPVAFRGEMMFSGALLAVSSPKPFLACFLQGHGEERLDDNNSEVGFQKFANIIRQNYIQIEPLTLDTNPVPMDCNLLIIAGPRTAIPDVELDQIEQYLEQGGRLFVAFNFYSVNRDTGLEKILAKWGIDVSHAIVRDAKKTFSGLDIAVENFTSHPVVSPLIGSELYLFQPRMVSKIDLPAPAAESLKVDEIAFSTPFSLLTDNSLTRPRSLSLMVAVEKNGASGIANLRGSTRILAVGDSLFMGNKGITSLANADFVSFAVNWLLDRTTLLEGIGPRPIDDYLFRMTQGQMQAVAWISLAAIPGGVLLLGGLVWLRRRK
jgi:hypothetical protein